KTGELNQSIETTPRGRPLGSRNKEHSSNPERLASLRESLVWPWQGLHQHNITMLRNVLNPING
ncbi:hypothetical protein BLA29_015487, partial [Euroglyphus maynei]